MELTHFQKGIVAITVGVLLLLNTLQILTIGVNTLIIIGALLLIAWGFMAVGGVKFVKSLFSNKKQQ